jgi:hypothetical protein
MKLRLRPKYCVGMYATLLTLLLGSGVSGVVSANVPSGIANEGNYQKNASIVFSSLLASFSVEARTGRLTLRNQLQTSYLPTGASGRVVLSKASGEEFCHWEWYLDAFRMPPPYRLMAFKDALGPDGTLLSYSDAKLSDPGKYVLDFYSEDQKFFSYPFTLRIEEPDHPSDGDALYLTDGAWNDWGYLYYSQADPKSNLIWKIFMRDEDHKKTYHSIAVKITRDSDGKLISQSREDRTYRLSHDWVRQDIVMATPQSAVGDVKFSRAADLLGKDGAYTLTLELDGDRYGTWKFDVRGGKLNYEGRTLREEADPLTFIEGGTDAFWYRRVQ